MSMNITYCVNLGQAEKHNAAHDFRSHNVHIPAMSEDDGPYFAAWRKFRGLTQQQATERTGIQQGLLSALERGARRYNQDHLADLAHGYDCEAWQLLGQNPFKPNSLPEALVVLEEIPEERRAMAIKALKVFIEDNSS